MKKRLVGLLVPLLLIVLAGCGSSSSSSSTYKFKSKGTIVGINTTTVSVERDELNATLAELGCTVVNYTDLSAEVVISVESATATVQAGKPYLQISDHGSDVIPNSFASIEANTSVQITLLGSHPITKGVDATWSTFGFWLYDPSVLQDYVGWGTSGTQASLANVSVGAVDQNGTLAVNDTNTSVYIGWNVYGSRATFNDKKVLDNSIAFLAGKL